MATLHSTVESNHNRNIQRAVIQELRQSGQTIGISDFLKSIRKNNEELRRVADYDFRMAILALKAAGAIESRKTGQIAAVANLG